MKSIKLHIVLILFISCLAACTNHSGTENNLSADSTKEANASVVVDSSIRIYSTDNNRFIVIDTLKFSLPINVAISDSNIFSGIYEYRSDSLVRHKFLITKNVAFLTTFEDLGRGIRSNLYAFDLASKSFVKDSIFKRDYLYSSAGVFVIDPKDNSIFAVDRPQWYDSKHENIVPASLYNIKGRNFDNKRNLYMTGSEVSPDSVLLAFFKNSMSSSKVVSDLPKDWWKIDSLAD